MPDKFLVFGYKGNKVTSSLIQFNIFHQSSFINISALSQSSFDIVHDPVNALINV
jgi:hypothetical protein